MRLPKHLVLLITLVLCFVSSSLAQTAPESASVRKAKILANLKHQIPQLARLSPAMGDIGPSGLAALDKGSFTILTQRGRQTQEFLVTLDDTQLYLIAAGPMDVSQDASVIALEESQAQADRHSKLMAAAKEDHLPVRGNPDAPVTIFEFSDFQCPYCSRAKATVDQVLAKHPDDVRLVYAHFPLNIHPWAKDAAIAASCVSSQNLSAFWKLHDFYFANQSKIKPETLLEQSKTFLGPTGIDMAKWATCAGDASSPAYIAASKMVEQTTQLGATMGVTGTPGFFINGQFLNGAQPIEAFEQAISAAKK